MLDNGLAMLCTFVMAWNWGTKVSDSGKGTMPDARVCPAPNNSAVPSKQLCLKQLLAAQK